MLAIQTPDQVQQQAAADAQARRDAEQAAYQGTQVTDSLAKHVRSCWEQAKSNRTELNARLMDCLRRRKGVYSATKLAAIKKTGGSEIFMRITGAKCRAARAWLADLFAPAGDRPWTLDPTPVPDLPPGIKQSLIQEAVLGAQQLGVLPEEVQALVLKHKDRLMDELKQEAEDRAERMADEIEDLLLESGWRKEFKDFLDDLVTFPFAVMKGLEFRRARKLEWVDQNGRFVPSVGSKIIAKVRRVSPFRCYPSPAVGNTLEGHWLIEHHTFTRQDLVNMRGAPGYNAEGIAHALNHYGLGGLREWMWNEQERATLEGRHNNYITGNDEIDALEWCGSLQGQQLLDWGMDSQSIPDPLDEYPVSVMVVGNYVIRALINPDPAGKPDYHKACWLSVPGSFVGEALPETLADCQDTCNASARALINNMGMSSGPQVWVENDRLAQGSDVSSIYPWKIWQSSQGNHSGAGIGFFQPDSHASELMQIYERFSKYADEITGLPAYAYGSDSGAGAAKTMGGLSILMNAASKTIKDVVRDVDVSVIEPIVEKAYNHLMLTSNKEGIKGDAVAKARGSEALVHKEASMMRQQELLGMTANPIDMQIIGIEGRREQLKEVYKSGDIPVDRIIPTREELAERLQQQQMAQQQQLAQQNGQPPQSPQ